MTVQLSSLELLVQKGLGSKKSRIHYASTYNSMDCLVHSFIQRHDALILPHNTSLIPRGPIEKINETFVEVKAKLGELQPSPKLLGTHVNFPVNAAYHLNSVVNKKHHSHELGLTYLFVQTSFGKRKPFKGNTHVDLEKFESGLLECLNTLHNAKGKPLNLGMTFFGYDSEYKTPWLDIESAIYRALDMTNHNVTIYIPSFIIREYSFFRSVGVSKVPSYIKNPIDQS